MKKFILLMAIVVITSVSAQQSMLPACGLDGSDHKCKCTVHVQTVQEDYMNDCILHTTIDSPREAVVYCMKSMPEHCAVVESYGNWHTDDEGEHDAPMPQQCTRACTKSHCRCADGPMCHFAHDPEEDEK